MSSSFFDNSNIDPQLLAMDPAQRILERIQQRSRINDDDDDNGLPPSSDAFVGFGSERSETSTSLATYGNLVKRRFGLKDQPAGELDQFCQTSSAEERQVLLYAQILQLNARLKDNEKVDTHYTIPAVLETSIKLYAIAFLLCHRTVAFRGSNAASHILNAMREESVKGLPNEKDVGHNNIVLRALRDKLTYFRNILKSKIKQSLKNGSSTRNIASLTNAIISKLDGIEPTLQLYMRIAYLRFCMINYGDLSDDAFWIKADQTLHAWQRAADTQTELSQILSHVYHEDTAMYGKPEDTEYTTVDLSSLAAWQVTLGRHAAKVQASKKRTFEEMSGTNGVDERQVENGAGDIQV
ncbi:hypothetical protein GGX14DRAFT_573537 [Mycena pura]|uniref:Uncharacterized protein n=1 Tax=Mycena pura TaxID=153505 RepID=A0AAD6UZP9_9AGAR|nr:hypothetical protein GGX14DRAFT_573537 [Mycena pura]